MKSLIVVHSYHHNNTQKVAQAMAKVLDAQVKSPQDTGYDELKKYDLIGFGAGIDSGKLTILIFKIWIYTFKRLNPIF